jgi:hypothetical protein
LRLLAVALSGVLAAGAVTNEGYSPLPTALPLVGFEPSKEAPSSLKRPREKAGEWRQEALSRAHVWRTPPPLSEIDLLRNPKGPGSFAAEEPVVCKFHLDEGSGSTPKFKCVFAGGEVLKVKYGRNPEIYTEVAASRLLEALGAGADRVYLVKTLRCFGCPEDPDALIRCLSSPFKDLRRRCAAEFGETEPEGDVRIKIDYSRFVDFAPVAIERRLPGETIEEKEGEGWGWNELDASTPASGPVRAERDALRLLTVVLNNWDNRRDNQRLVCLPGGTGGDSRCRRPFAYMHDVGGTFGRVGGRTKAERKLDLEGWSEVPVWKDAATCRVEIDSPALHGATFGEATISESGRRFLVERLARIPESEIRDLFEGARFAEYEEASPASRDVGNWVRVFQGKVRQIADRPPCPTP